MNPAFETVIAASDDDRRGLFLTTANRIGTTAQNIEKDFWVCWTLDALFNRLKAGAPRLLFKGGTSLSKAHSLITRFSEDIDVTVFRPDITADISLEELEALSNNKRNALLGAIKDACQGFIGGQLMGELEVLAATSMDGAGKDPRTLRILPDEKDPDRQSLLIYYPSVLTQDPYVEPYVKIESGAKSALDPHKSETIIPYVAADLPTGTALAVPGVTTIAAERTFLDKILILHGMTHYFEAAGRLRGNGRMSRHYYDVHCLMAASIGEKACGDSALVADCARHARMFFNRSNSGLERAAPGSFRLSPTADMIAPLKRDYGSMSVMIFGGAPSFEAVLDSVAHAETLLNGIR